MKIRNFRGSHGSMKQAVFCIILRLMVYNQAAAGFLIEEPENTVALFNATVTFTCKSDGHNEKLMWTMHGNGSEEDVIFNGYFLNSKACPLSCCKINNPEAEPGRYNLKIIARKESAKRFMCTEPGTLTRATADLIVIASNLTCNYNVTADEVALTCSIGVYGEWSPQIKWMNNHGERMSETSVSAENGQVTSTLITPLPSRETYVTASVYWSETDRPPKVTAKNVPTIYVAEWISPQFKLETKESNTHWIATVAVGVLCAFVAVAALIIVNFCFWKKDFRYRFNKTKDGSSTEEKKDFIKRTTTSTTVTV